MTPPRRTHRRPHRRRGMTLVELLLGLAITGIIGAAIASMLFGAARGTDATNDMRGTLVGQRTATARITAAIRAAQAVLAAEDDLLVLWVNDDDADGLVGAGELRRIERDAATQTLTSYRATAAAPADAYPLDSDFAALTASFRGAAWFPAAPWAAGVSSLEVAVDAPDPQDAALVSYRLTVERGGATTDTLAASAALRNMR